VFELFVTEFATDVPSFEFGNRVDRLGVFLLIFLYFVFVI